jgi:hypothetical protein
VAQGAESSGVLDKTPPTNPKIIRPSPDTIFTNSPTISVEWKGSSDPESGIKEYEYTLILEIHAIHMSFEWKSKGLETSFTLPYMALSSGDRYKVLVRAINNVGLFSQVASSPEVIVDTTPPSVSFEIKGGTLIAISPEVTLNLSATDTISGADKMEFSNDDITYTAPEPYAPTKFWTIRKGVYKEKVYAKVQDRAGNYSAPISVIIVLDILAPEIIHNPIKPTIQGNPITFTAQILDKDSGVNSAEVIVYFIKSKVTFNLAMAYNKDNKLYQVGLEGNVVSQNMEYYIRAKDNAGNVSESKTYNIIVY